MAADSGLSGDGAGVASETLTLLSQDELSEDAAAGEALLQPAKIRADRITAISCIFMSHPPCAFSLLHGYGTAFTTAQPDFSIS